MKKGKKMHYLILLGLVFLLGGIVMNIETGETSPYIYFGVGTLVATAIYYGIVEKRPQIAAFIIGLIVMHSGILLIIKGELTYPLEFGMVTFISGILVLLNSGFSEYMRDRKKNS
ncbi:MAG: hypothetical protein MIO93_15990 [ANME-2 cluster archaeon]|jgi:hypothetical protein|nr:hypothetical protein [ANME-2 cluster archaeon]